MRDAKDTLIQSGDYITFARGRSALLELGFGTVTDVYIDKIVVVTPKVFNSSETTKVTLRTPERILVLR